MAFNLQITQNINNTITEYNKQISTKWNIPLLELEKLWNGETPTQSEAPPVPSVPVPDPLEEAPLDYEHLSKCLKAELKFLCKKRGLRTGGTKAVLIKLLLGGTAVPPKEEKAEVKTKVKTKDKVPVISKIREEIQPIAIRRNQFGNHEHPETSFVFDKKTKKVIGKQNPDGTIEQLEKSDIDICNKYKFDWVMPENLDRNTELDDVKVQELEDDPLEEVQEEEEEIFDEEELLEEEEYDEEEYEYEEVYE